ncbi:MAG: hypothetical protein LBH73_03180 [Spirochaetaceae bacterium]|jgi:hypothetical protein|nr:hypothetical protein [Spirochaetaceae bacterium]
MSDNVNPYESPQSDLNARSPLTGGAGITENMVKYLKETSPWVRFVGIIGFIISGLCFLGGAVLLIPGFVAANAFGSTFGKIPVLAMALLYLIAGLLCLIPARFLYRFGSKARNYVQTGMESELEGALKSNRSYWKFCGIMILACIISTPVLTIVLLIVGISSRFI